MSISHNSHFPTLIIFKMDDDGSALRVGKRSSLLRCFGQFLSYVICFYENLFTVINYFWQNKVVLTYGHPSCLPLFLHQVKMFFSNTFQMKCPMSIRVRCKDDETLEITNIVLYMIILKLKISMYILFL